MTFRRDKLMILLRTIMTIFISWYCLMCGDWRLTFNIAIIYLP